MTIHDFPDPQPGQDLTRHLERRADEFERLGGAPLDLAQVLDRAGEIKRGRRMRATLVMAAAVLAVAVPAGIVAAGGHHEKPVTPTHETRLDQAPITIDGLRAGDAPRLAYVESGALHRKGFAYASEGERYVGVAEYTGGIMLAVRHEDGTTVAHALGTGPRQTWPISGDFAVSQARDLVAFVEPNGSPVVIQDGGSQTFRLPKIPSGSAFDTVAVVGDDCSGQSATAACVVYVTSKGEHPTTWIVRPNQPATELTRPGALYLSALSHDDLAAWVTRVTDTGTCSNVYDMRQGSLWDSCDHRLLAFSPDGRRLLASSPYADAAGDNELTVLGARTGSVDLDLRTPDQALVAQMTWEDDDHVLAVVQQGGRAAILRIGIDGSREYAVAPVKAPDPYESPFVLPSR